VILNKRLALRHRCERHSWAVLPLQTVSIDPERIERTAMQTPDQTNRPPEPPPAEPVQKKPGEEPAGNESNNPLGDPNDVGTAGDYSR
jgi:hypothetical protein